MVLLMRIVFIGPPGIGKGTYAKMLSQKYGIPHISTGDIFREEIAKGSELGQKVKHYVEKGLLVPDEVVIKVVEQRLSRPDCERGFILDGFPRTINQAIALDNIAKIESAIVFEAPLNIIIERVSGRIICPNCGAIYHMSWKPPKNPWTCDICGSKLIRREDDSPDVVRRRYEAYEQTFGPIIEYYRRKGILIEIDASKEAPEVVKELEEILKKKGILKT